MPEAEAVVGHTESVCPVCLKRIAARRVVVNGEVRLVKDCPEHGRFSAVIWRGEPKITAWRRAKIPTREFKPATAEDRGCPYDCGLCGEHNQRTCTALIEVTRRCDLMCPLCFAQAGGKGGDPSLEVIGGILDRVMELSGPSNIQLSGGEPTVRGDLPEIIALVKARGFGFVQLNTHGLRFARESGYAARLKESGLDSVFLQFDGVSDGPCLALRGKPLVEEKFRAVDALCEAGVGVVLVPVLKPGVNDRQLGDIIRFAAGRSPGVRGVHFQPVSYFGRYFEAPGDEDRITLPEVMRALEKQTAGQVRSSHFHPPGCEHELCSFSAKYLVMPGGALRVLSPERGTCCSEPEDAALGARRAMAQVAGQWVNPAAGRNAACCCETDGPLDIGEFLNRAASHVMTISAMAFQDAWTLDLERLRGCCIHVATGDGRLVPFCVYNLTSMHGRSLYRGV